MANLGNAWHIPANPEPHDVAGMRDPLFPTIPVAAVAITSGNQFQGDGNPGNQLQDGSSVLFKRSSDNDWASEPLTFAATTGDNKYYQCDLPTGGFPVGTVVDYYLRIAYDDHDTTFLQLGPDRTTSATTADERAAQARPFSFTIETPAVRGQWGPVFPLPNVAIHAHVLPSGVVLMWGRRDDAGQSLDVDPPRPLQPDGPTPPPAHCTPFLWDPSSGEVTLTDPPATAGGANANLFCAGHAFLADGRLVVGGGHLADSAGLDATTVYDPTARAWAPSASMAHGRWYPTLTGLQDGSVLIVSGSYKDPTLGVVNNTVPERWNAGAVSETADSPPGAFDLFPRMHLASNGLVFMTGSLQQTWTLDVSSGLWAGLSAERQNGQRDYAPSVLYDVDKVIYIGGGNPPTANAELLDMSEAQPEWVQAAPMSFPRRQHNATILPDGTVLVTGGTRSGGAGPPQAFNNLDPGQPVHVAELWNPATGAWIELAAEKIDRCYHSTAALLPDGRVLSAGGGEFFPVEAVSQENDPGDSHRDAQIFSPPYLFRGARPAIGSAPDATKHGETFRVGTDQAEHIALVTWVRLSSVTHSFNGGQRFLSLSFQATAGGLNVTAPSSPAACPPGHYMMFLVDRDGIPSIAHIVQVPATVAAPHAPMTALAVPVGTAHDAPRAEPAPAGARDALAQRAAVLAAASGTKVVVGLTGICPYGIGACWGGANEALRRLEAVQYVDPIPDAENSTAAVFLLDDRLPPLPTWHEQFRAVVNDNYILRGVEVTLTGPVEVRGKQLFIEATETRPAVALAPLSFGAKVQLNRAARSPQSPLTGETNAYASLVDELRSHPRLAVTVTGPLSQAETGYTLQVRAVDHFDPT